MSVLRQAKILYLFTNAEREGGDNVGYTGRFNANYGYAPALEHDFVLRVSRPQWDRLPDHLRDAVVYHHLLRFGSDTIGRWRMEPYDYQGFIAALEQFREEIFEWSDGLKRARQLGLFDGIASGELADRGELVTR